MNSKLNVRAVRQADGSVLVEWDSPSENVSDFHVEFWRKGEEQNPIYKNEANGGGTSVNLGNIETGNLLHRILPSLAFEDSEGNFEV